ncbi:MAG: Integral membrane protein [Nitrospira sp.]|jgi:putative membrane protein|nr:MAG: Integral membrane protein [Nitrospira sp.]
MDRVKCLLIGLMTWYIGLFAWLAYSPVDRQFWAMASVLPVLFVIGLVASYRYVPLSPLSYILIMGFLTLHTVGVHYTYAQVPAGAWLNDVLHLGRNHFDRIVHFSFGFLLAYPMEETFRLLGRTRGWVLYYLPVITVLGLSALWEILEAWVTQAVHPELGPAYLGAQGDVWDAQKDMAAAMYGSLLCMGILLGFRILHKISLGTAYTEMEEREPVSRVPGSSS